MSGSEKADILLGFVLSIIWVSLVVYLGYETTTNPPRIKKLKCHCEVEK